MNKWVAIINQAMRRAQPDAVVKLVYGNEPLLWVEEEGVKCWFRPIPLTDIKEVDNG